MSIASAQLQQVKYHTVKMNKSLTQRSVRPSTRRPVYKMSVGLIETYKNINRRYYNKSAKGTNGLIQSDSRAGVYNYGYDDDDYNYIVSENEIFAERYILEERIGKGSFGQVVRAFDQQTRQHVAIKIIKSKRQFTLQARTEHTILTTLNEHDRNDEHNIVKLLNSFVYRGHQCFVFEKLSYNLYELLRKSNFEGVSLNLVRKFANEILKTLDFLSQPDINIIHCDLKPENILLRHEKRSAIKVIDFGSSCHVDHRMFSYIQSRFYRSPEVLLGLSYGTSIDMWSLGCILVEMHTGEPLFSGSDESDQMYRIIQTLGMPPPEMIENSPHHARSKFFEYVDGNWTMNETMRINESRRKSLIDTIGVTSGGPGGRRLNQPGHDASQYMMFHDLIKRTLSLDPERRISPSMALQHPFLLNNNWTLSSPVSSSNHSENHTLHTSRLNKTDAETQTCHNY
mmetsp:Transcript_35139/g.44393  ORF Transcript_35139/g.44393 Transcript_35139/m.44393 type:complete len:455 (-) Transcript_35139:19-1383(-)